MMDRRHSAAFAAALETHGITKITVALSTLPLPIVHCIPVASAILRHPLFAMPRLIKGAPGLSCQSAGRLAKSGGPSSSSCMMDAREGGVEDIVTVKGG